MPTALFACGDAHFLPFSSQSWLLQTLALVESIIVLEHGAWLSSSSWLST